VGERGGGESGPAEQAEEGDGPRGLERKGGRERGFGEFFSFFSILQLFKLLKFKLLFKL
jgi:hypothetical protein